MTKDIFTVSDKNTPASGTVRELIMCDISCLCVEVSKLDYFEMVRTKFLEVSTKMSKLEIL